MSIMIEKMFDTYLQIKKGNFNRPFNFLANGWF
jgi:hypothetical protein